MKTESEQAGEAARATVTVVVLDPEGKELRRFDGVAGWMIGAARPSGEMSLDSNLPPEIGAGMLELLRTRYVTMPYLAAIERQMVAQAPRVVPVPAAGLTGVAPAVPLNSRPRIVMP